MSVSYVWVGWALVKCQVLLTMSDFFKGDSQAFELPWTGALSSKERWGDAVEQSSLLQAYCLYYLLAIMTVSSGERKSLSELVRFRVGQVEYFRGHGRLR